MFELKKTETEQEETKNDSSQNFNEPSWLKELRDRYLSGESIMFILHSNVLDLVAYENTFLPLKEFLTKGLLNKNKEVVIYYDASEGVNFSSLEMKKKFFKTMNAKQILMGEEPLSEDLPVETSAVLPLFESFLKTPNQSAGLVLGYAETFLQQSQISFLSQQERANLITLQRWASDPLLLNSDNLIILITQNLADINQKIVSNPQVCTIEIPMPEYDERLEYINHIKKNYVVDMEMNEEQLSFLTAGLRRIQIEGLFRQAKKSNKKISYEILKNRKKEIVENECFGLIEFVEPTHDLDTVGGMQPVKSYLKRVIKNIKDGNYSRVPMGIFFVGPMGTGKTFIAEAFAKECNLTCLKLKNFRAGLVGGTEANLEKILHIIKALGSVLVIMDEVDRALDSGQGGGDSGTSSRVYARIKAFMSDTTNRGKILWLVMSNRPDKLDIDLKRSGRFDSKIPFFYPESVEEVTNVIVSLLKKNKINYQIDDFTKTAEILSGYSGADIEAILLNAEGISSDLGCEKLLEEHFISAIEDFIPNRDSLTIEFMEYLAVFECSSRKMLPNKFKNLTNEQINDRLRELQRFID